MPVDIQNRQQLIPVDRRRVRGLALRLLRLLSCAEKELSLVLVDNEAIRELNRRYLGRDWPTNVLSFSMTEGFLGDTHSAVLGDVVISLERAAADAEKEGLTLDEEVTYLIIHGTLHLLGYDHEGPAADKGKRMGDEETALFRRLTGKDLESLL